MSQYSRLNHDYFNYWYDAKFVLERHGDEGLRAYLQEHPLPPYAPQTMPDYLVTPENEGSIAGVNFCASGINGSARDGSLTARRFLRVYAIVHGVFYSR
ncbi:MAG: hypothetical protein HYY37_04945 [Candidatus Aenigmarchaeota archaeon]|nr:hypothetical protein [Candidatus Aenigmarchaeota archaeon]